MKKRVVDGIFAVVFLVLGFVFLATSANGVTGAVIGVSNLVGSFLNLALAGIFLALSMVAASGGENKEDKSLEELVNNMSSIANYGLFIEGKKVETDSGFAKENKIDKNSLYENMGLIYSNFNQKFGPDLFVAAGTTHSARLALIETYLKAKKEDVNKKINALKEKVIDDYLGILSEDFNKQWSKIEEKLKKDKKDNEDIQKKKHDAEITFYTHHLADNLVCYSESGSGKEYDPEVIAIIDNIKAIEGLMKENNIPQLKKRIASGVISDPTLLHRALVSSGAPDAWAVHSPEIVENDKVILINHFINKGKIDKGKLIKYLDNNPEAYAGMSRDVVRLKYNKKE